MVHRTRLYQQARSPLIQGRSKIERPIWENGIMGSAVSFVAWGVVLAGDVAGELGILVSDNIKELGDLVPAPALALAGAALVGGWLGAWLASQMGWHRGWKTAAVFAAVFDLVAFLIVR